MMDRPTSERTEQRRPAKRKSVDVSYPLKPYDMGTRHPSKKRPGSGPRAESSYPHFNKPGTPLNAIDSAAILESIDTVSNTNQESGVSTDEEEALAKDPHHKVCTPLVWNSHDANRNDG